MVGGAFGVFYNFGTLIVFVLGALLHWRWLLLVCAGFPILNLIMLQFASETPTWYMLRGRTKDALSNLNTLRGDTLVAKDEYDRLTDNYQKRQECTVKTKDVKRGEVLIQVWPLTQFFSVSF